MNIKEITEIDFISPCPVASCIQNNKSFRWLHSNCDGREKLNDQGELRCLKCGTKGEFVDWHFDCGNHGYKKASRQGVIHALAIMSQVAINPEQQSFLANATRAIMKQFKNLPKNQE